MKQLKPCPFCGSEKILTNQYIWDGREVCCGKCGASVHAYNPDANNKAIAAWNRRHTGDAQH